MTEMLVETFSPPTPRYRGDEINDLKELGPGQREILEAQLRDYALLNELELHSNLRESLMGGDATLPEGTLIHGAAFSGETVEGFARYGVVSGEHVGRGEYGETHYCADFFRVEEDTTVAQYCEDVMGMEPRSRVKPRMEGEYIPSAKRSSQNLIGIIVDPTIPELQDLLEADAYTPGTEELFEGIINTLPVDKNSPRANRLAAILVGVPRGAIAGVIVGPAIANDTNALTRIDQAFSGRVPMLSVTGELLSAK